MLYAFAFACVWKRWPSKKWSTVFFICLAPSIFFLRDTVYPPTPTQGTVIFVDTKDGSPKWLEDLLRPITTMMGHSAGISLSPLLGCECKRVAVPYSLSHAWRIGDAVRRAVHAKQDPVSALVQTEGGRLLAKGKVCNAVCSLSIFRKPKISLYLLREAPAPRNSVTHF